MFGIESAMTGRITKDPELRMVKGGTMAMVMMSVLVDEAPPKEGQEAKPTWVNAKLFGERAQNAADSLKKGDSVYLEGRLSLDEWQGRQGEARHGLSLLANVVQAQGQIGRRKPQGQQQHRAQSPSTTHSICHRPGLADSHWTINRARCIFRTDKSLLCAELSPDGVRAW